MELYQLRSFVAVADERHFGRAANRLHLSAAPVSRAVRALEAEIGSTLFVRGAGEVRLIEVGAALHKRAAEILRNAESFGQYARELRAAPRGPTLGGTI